MIKRLILSTTIIAAFVACSGQKKTVEKPAPSIFDFDKTITAEGLRADLSVLADDSLEGRDTGKEGLNKAANYLAKRYETLGLEPVGDNGTYFQHFDLDAPVTNSVTYTVMDMDGNVVDESTHSPESIATFSSLIGGSGSVSGDIVFAGYGIVDEDKGINQLPEDVQGKWLLLFYDRAITNFRALQGLIGEDKAVGAILIMGTDVDSFNSQAERQQESFGQPGRLSLSYLNSDDGFASAIDRVNPEFAATMLGLDDLEALSQLEASIKESPDAFEPSTVNYSLKHVPDFRNETVTVQNVVAFIEGSDSLLKNEVVVLSSHYDHVGIGRPDSTGDTIYNGADDDGSGTVATLHAAQAIMNAVQAGAELKRSVLFLHVAGEEKGLLGSRYYSDHPIFPIEETVANINIDMVGRLDPEHENDPDYIYVIGGKIISSGLQAMMEEANAQSVNITLSDRYNDLDDPNQFYRRSDHWNFGRLGVPFVFFFNGTHADYHRPSDSVDKIHFDALTKRTQLVYMTTAKVANTVARPEVDNQIFIEKTQQNPRN